MSFQKFKPGYIDTSGTSNGQVLVSNGTSAYWSSVAGGAGANGFTGSTGFTGSQGEIGYTGSAGTNGFTGSKGDVGFVGSAGAGFTGSQGNIGPIGYTGSPGSGGGGVTLATTAYTSGSLLTGENTYTARWYPGRSITINTVRAWVISPGSRDVQVSIRKNNVTQLTMNVVSTAVTVSNSSFSATANDYLTVIVENDGNIARDLYTTFVYTLDS